MKKSKAVTYKYFKDYKPARFLPTPSPASSRPLTEEELKLIEIWTRKSDIKTLDNVNNPISVSQGKAAIKAQIFPSARVKWVPTHGEVCQPAEMDVQLGSRMQLADVGVGVGRELIIGLDFGTSSTKVVISDKNLQANYAVPLVNAVGIDAYLLPSSLFEDSAGFYNLCKQGIRHRDLKLTMLRNFQDEFSCVRVCAFLALVIRNSRAWLFESRGEQYLHADILWTLALGQPADPDESERWRDHFESLARVAWELSLSAGDISAAQAHKVWRARTGISRTQDLEVMVMAELSAQIHGFVSSSGFDPRQQNIYFIADVGGGTVDASVFHVKKYHDGGVDISIFSCAVELLGAAILNTRRIRWWKELLEEALREHNSIAAGACDLIVSLMHDLDKLQLPTEFSGNYPAACSDYLEGVLINSVGNFETADQIFLQEVLQKTFRRVLLDAWKQQKLSQSIIKGLPFFLCGGGARHRFYSQLTQAVQKTPNCSWLNASPRVLVVPTNLTAPGVTRQNYDRLSVAYGLSSLSRESLRGAPAMKTQVSSPVSDSFISSTTDKSSC